MGIKKTQKPTAERARIPGLEASGAFKCVQLVVAGQDYLRIDRLDTCSHHNILQTALEEFGLNPKKFINPDSFDGCFFVDTGRYKVVGMGSLILRAEREFLFDGESKGYEMGIDREQIVRLRPYFPEQSVVFVNGERI